MSRFTERIKVNRVWREERDGRLYWIKRRRRSGGIILRTANGFFRAAKAKLTACADLPLWQAREVNSFVGLHGNEGFRAFGETDRVVGAEQLPGINLTAPLDEGTITPEMAAAAGRELCRAHAWVCRMTGELWSHGDAHAGNFIWEPQSERARIIDFEVMHTRGLPAAERHSDDLLAFIQDIAGRINESQWLPCAEAFLSGYDRSEIIDLLWPQLRERPAGMARLWWRVRTSFLPVKELAARFNALHSLRH